MDRIVTCKLRFLDEDFFKKYKERGFDIIRLAITRQSLEPEPEKA